MQACVFVYESKASYSHLLILIKYYMKNQITELWDLLVDNGLATEQTLQVITSINGYTLETLNDVLYAITGCRCIEQYHAEGVQIDAIA